MMKLKEKETDWRNFEKIIEKARAAMRGMGVDPSNQIVETNNMIETGKGALANE